uniref:Uncharacterized protein n=2 Tax=Oryza brachyantha TaxID=4533 RepID=J3KXR7_ORYBR
MSSRIAFLEARVSSLEAENARLRGAMAGEGEPAGRAGNGNTPTSSSRRFGGGNAQGEAEVAGGRVAARDVVEVSDSDEEAEAEAEKGRAAEEGTGAVPIPRKRAALRVVTGESGDEDEVEDAEAGGGDDGGDQGSVSCGDNAGLEDDDVSATPHGRKRAAALVVTSDSEDEVGSWGGRRRGKDDNRKRALRGGRDDEDDDEGEGVTLSRKRALRGDSDSENEDGGDGAHVVATGIESDDDMIPIREVVKKMRKERVSKGGGELGETEGCSTPTTRRSARLAKGRSKRPQSARRALNFVEPKDCQESECDSDEDDDINEFIINDSDCSENSAEPEDSDASAPTEGSSSELEESDNEIDYKDVMACIGRKRNTKEWKFEAEMLSAFAENPELCLKAVCALYRKQTEDEQRSKSTIVHNKQGFNQFDALRGSSIAEFLLDGDTFGLLKKTVHDLEEYDPCALEFCHKLAARYSKQLFSIYQNKEDPNFHP